MRAISARIWTRSFASRFESGSSIRNAFGSRTIARPHRDTLPLPTGQLRRPALQHVTEAEHARDLLDTPLLLLLRHLPHAQPERQVFVDGLVWIERVVLEDHRDVAIARGEVVHDLAGDPDLARADLLEPGDHAQGSRLAAPGRADEYDELALCDLEVEVTDRDHVAAVDLGKVDELDLGHYPRTAPAVSPNAIRRCTSRKNTTTGIAQSVAPPSAGPSPFRAAS